MANVILLYLNNVQISTVTVIHDLKIFTESSAMKEREWREGKRLENLE